MEVLDYSTYFQPTVLFETMGFAQPLDSSPLLLLPGVLKLAWGGVVSVLAEGLGVELDRIDEWYERFPAARTYDLAVGTVPEGTQAGLRFEVRGIVGGEPRIVLEHVTRHAPRGRARVAHDAGAGRLSRADRRQPVGRRSTSSPWAPTATTTPATSSAPRCVC